MTSSISRETPRQEENVTPSSLNLAGGMTAGFILGAGLMLGLGLWLLPTW